MRYSTGLHHLVSLGLIVICLLGAFGWSSPVNARSSPLRIGLMPDVNSLVFVVAEREGIFDRMGVDVELVKFQSASTRDSALQAGEIDVAVSDLLAALFALEGGLEVKVTSVTEGRYAIVVSRQSGITHPRELEGKQIAVSKNTIIEYAVDRMLESRGVDVSKVRKISIPQVPVRLQMLASGKLDAACLPDPMAVGAEVAGGLTIIDSTDVHISPSVMVFRRESLEQHRENWAKVAAACNEAAELLNARENDYWRDVYEEMGFPRPTWDAIKLPVYQPSHPPSREDFASVLMWMQEKGLVKRDWRYDEVVDR